MAFRSAMLATAAVAALGLGMLANPSVAFAGSGDFTGCDTVYLNSATTCWGPHSHEWVETEGYAALDDGTGSCTGAGTGSGNGTNQWYGYVCVPNTASGSNASLCIAQCDGVTGYGFVHDHATWADYFTGWGDYF
jgi:hypothetical protein